NRSTIASAVVLNFTPGAARTLSDGTTFDNVEHLDLTTGSGDDHVTFDQPVWDELWGGNYWNAGAGNDTVTVDLSTDVSGINALYNPNYNIYRSGSSLNFL